ncbi:MAG: hypothetical protein ACI9TY_001389 [Alphaproteobacteria bacterium]
MLVNKTNVIQLEVDGTFESFDGFDGTQTIDVSPEQVHVETKSQRETVQPEKHTYAHHGYYNDGYASPELPEMAKHYSSNKAKSFMFLFSLALIAVTASVVQTTQNKIDYVAQEREKLTDFKYRSENQKIASTMDMMQLNTVALEESVTKMGQIVNNRKALVEMETALRKQKAGEGGIVSDAQARDMLLRAGYQPAQIDEKQMTSYKQKYAGVEGDVDFARDVAGDIVQEEVESFVHKMKLISSVGEYIYNRSQ